MAKRSNLIKANKLVSQFIRKIATEETEFLKGQDGDDSLVTKAEALARLIWKKALGYTDVRIDSSGETEISHEPDKGYVNLLIDRLEGTARPVVGDSGKRTTAQKVNDEGKKRINGILGSGKEIGRAHV